MSKGSVFDFKDYKAYLNSTLEHRALQKKGQRSKLAEFIGCKPAYLSQVFNGVTDLSAEQAQATNIYLSHTVTEARYFLNLVLLSRAGTRELRSYYDEELKQQRQERLVIKNRVQINRTLNETDQARYYSSWYFAAIHVAVSLPHLRSKEQLAEALSLPQATVNQVLEFLVQMGVLKLRGNEYSQGEINLFLGTDSNFINKHHSNWRIKAVQSLDQPKENDLHFSGVITCSTEDAIKIKETMIKTVQKIRETVRASKDETLHVYALDLFSLLN